MGHGADKTKKTQGQPGLKGGMDKRVAKGLDWGRKVMVSKISQMDGAISIRGGL